MRLLRLLIIATLMYCIVHQARAAEPLPEAPGYRGIWYHIGTKYSGGFATYPQQIRPMAIYAEKVNKTFFVFGGTDEKNSTLLHMISYFDHATGTVPKPRILLDKKTTDAHDNPALMIDETGHLFIFSNTHGPKSTSYIHRSVEPFSIEEFEKVFEGSFSYGQPWWVPGKGAILIHNRYQDGRAIAFMTSRDGLRWSAPKLIAQMPKGHYQISIVSGQRIGLAFNYHPNGLDTRTNLYYLQSDDLGDTWQTIDGKTVPLPLKDPHGDGIVVDAERLGLLVYLKDIQFEENGRPVIVYLTSKFHMPGEQYGPHQWMLARRDGDAWKTSPITTSDHNYDFGQLYLESENLWRLIAPTDPGPQPWMTGGEVVSWTTNDRGDTWQRAASITTKSKYNYTYIRAPLNARDDFYAFWADGNPTKASQSRLYFVNKEGNDLRELPLEMKGPTATPVPVTSDETP